MSLLNQEKYIQAEFLKRSELLSQTGALIPDLLKLRQVLEQCWQQGGKVLVCGNGGSAAQAQHFVAELQVRYQKNRQALAALALNTDTSILSAISNDWSFEQVFSRQIEALGKAQDVLCVLSTSGQSKNIVRALEKAQEKGLICVGLLGGNGGSALKLCQNFLLVPHAETALIQEIHLSALHILCQLIEANMPEIA